MHVFSQWITSAISNKFFLYISYFTTASENQVISALVLSSLLLSRIRSEIVSCESHPRVSVIELCLCFIVGIAMDLPSLLVMSFAVYAFLKHA